MSETVGLFAGKCFFYNGFAVEDDDHDDQEIRNRERDNLLVFFVVLLLPFLGHVWKISERFFPEDRQRKNLDWIGILFLRVLDSQIYISVPRWWLFVHC